VDPMSYGRGEHSDKGDEEWVMVGCSSVCREWEEMTLTRSPSAPEEVSAQDAV
jgi:hypothetical protein